MADKERAVEEVAKETIARAYEDSWGAAQGLSGGEALYLDPDDFGAFVAKALRVAGLLRDDGRDEFVELVRRAAPYVNAVACMATDKAPSLGWIADASRAVAAFEKAATETDGGSP